MYRGKIPSQAKLPGISESDDLPILCRQLKQAWGSVTNCSIAMHVPYILLLSGFGIPLWINGPQI